MKVITVDKTNYSEIVRNIITRTDDSDQEIDNTVENIIKEVKQNGDVALFKYTKSFDGVELNNLKVRREEVEEAVNGVDENFIDVLAQAKKNIWSFHEKQLDKTWLSFEQKDIALGQKISPIDRIGIYVPGGKAAYPSTVLMNAIPAKVAGVKSIAMVTPPGKDGKINPYILTAAKIAGIEEIYKLGGAQAVAALAYGTESITRVNKIVGPGNIYVARAKMKVFGKVAIDMIAGPSEICIITDDNANEKFIAADLLSQAEHDEMASAILITTSQELAKKTAKEVEFQLKQLDRCEIATKAINDYGIIIVVDDLNLGIEIANEIAPEHLQLMVKNPFELLPQIRNAGAIFLGHYTPEPLGDYFAGPNHTLPTSGTAKFSSPLGVYDFMKKSSVIYYGKQALEEVKDQVITFAEKEGLTAHANSLKVRFL